jgi:hypothetical protein
LKKLPLTMGITKTRERFYPLPRLIWKHALFEGFASPSLNEFPQVIVILQGMPFPYIE